MDPTYIVDRDGYHHKQIAEFFAYVHICNCGTATFWVTAKYVMDRAAAPNTPNRLGNYDPAEDASGRWVEFAAQVLDSWGILMHGGAIGWAVLTPLGEELMRFFNEFGTVKNQWPDWARSVYA